MSGSFEVKSDECNCNSSVHDRSERKFAQTITSILEDEDCAAAFLSNFSTTPEGLVAAGTVFGAASLLSNPFNLQMMGISQHSRDRYVKKGAVGSTAVQGFTIRNWQGYPPDTVDGLPRIFWEVIRDLVKTALADSDCIAFYRTILRRVSTNSNPVIEGGDLTKIFGKFEENGSFSRIRPPRASEDANAHASGLIGSKSGATIHRYDRGGDITFWDAYFTIGELFHLAGSKAMYDDRALADAIRGTEYEKIEKDVMRPEANIYSPQYNRSKLETKQTAYSRYFHSIQQVPCKVTRPPSYYNRRY